MKSSADACRLVAQKRARELAGISEEEAAKTRTAIEELDRAVCVLQQMLAEECFYSFQTSPAEARTKIKETSERTGELLRRMEVNSRCVELPSESCEPEGPPVTSRRDPVLVRKGSRWERTEATPRAGLFIHDRAGYRVASGVWNLCRFYKYPRLHLTSLNC